MADDIVPLKEYRRGAYAMPDATARLQQFNDQMVYKLARERYRRAQLVVSADSLSPKTGDKMRQILRMYPGVSATGLAAAVDLPDTPESEAIRQLLTLDAIVNNKEVSLRIAKQDSPVGIAEAGGEPESDGGFDLMGAIRGFVRTGFDVLDAPVRAVQGAIRSAYGAVSEEGDWLEAGGQIAGILPPVAAALEASGAYGDRPNPWEQTNFGQSIYAAMGIPEEGWTSGDRVPTKAGAEAQGTGWFTDPESEVGKRQLRAVRKAAPLTSQNKAWTLGRGFTDAFADDPDSTRARFASGVIDAAAVLFLDPLIFAGGVGKIGQGRKAAELAGKRSDLGVKARTALEARKAAEDAPERIAELSQIRDELRAARILADARHGSAKYTSIEQSGRVNTGRIAEMERQVADLTGEQRRVQHAIDLITREEKVLGRSAQYQVTAKGAETVTPQQVIDEIEQMFEAGAKPAERVESLARAFDSGVDPIEVRTVWQQNQMWRRRSSLWRRAMEKHDIAKGQAARRETQQVADESAQVLSDLSNAEIANGLNELTRATDLPGTVLHTPRHLPYTRYVDNPVDPFQSTDDVFVALVDSEPALVRLPTVAEGQTVALGKGARVADDTAKARLSFADVTVGKAEGSRAWVAAPGSVGSPRGKNGLRALDKDGNILRPRQIADAGDTIDTDSVVDLVDVALDSKDKPWYRLTDDYEWLPVSPAKFQTRSGGSKWTDLTFDELDRIAARRANAAGKVEDLGKATKAIIPMHNGNSLSFRKGGMARLDVTDSELDRIVSQVGKAYNDAGDLVDITDFRVATIEANGRLSKAKETVQVQGTRAIDEAAEGAAATRAVTAPTVGGEYQAAARVVEAGDQVPGAIWREILDRLPDAVASGPGRTMLADLAKGRGGPLDWGEVIEFAKRYDVLTELNDLLMLNGVVAVKGLGRAKSITWVPDHLGASVTFINKARVKGGVVAPPPVTQASIRKVRYEQKLRAIERDLANAGKELESMRAYQTVASKKSQALWKAVDEQRAAVSTKADAARRALEAGEDADLDALSDELAELIKDLAIPREIDATRSLDLSGLASLIDPKHGRLLHPFTGAVDTLMRRVGGDGVIEQLAKIDNVATLNRLAKGRWDRDFLLKMADAKSTDEVRLLIASMLDYTPDTFENLARSSRKAYTGWKGGSVADRVARQLEIVSTRNPAIDLNNPEQSAIYLNRWLRTIGTPQDKADTWVSSFLRADSAPERADILFHTVGDGLRDDLLAKTGASLDDELGQAIQKATRMVGDHFRETQGWFTERTAHGSHVNGGIINGEWVDFGGPNLFIELADSTIRLPDVVELRRFNTAYGRVLEGKTGESMLKAVADYANRLNDMWRTWLLVRGAYVVRNILETQMRAYVLGSHNAITNPLMFMGMMLSGADTKTARALRPFFDRFNKYNSLGPGVDMSFFQRQLLDPDDLDQSGKFADTAIRLFNENVHGGAAPQDFRAVQAVLNGYEPKLVANGDRLWNIGHAREMLVLRSDPLARVVAGAYPDTVETAIRKGAPVEDAILDWLYTSREGREIIETFNRVAPKQVRNASAWMDREWVRGYLFDWPGSVRSQISAATGDNPRLIGYLKTGELTDEAGNVLYKFDPVRKQREIAAKSSPRKIADDTVNTEEYAMARAITDANARGDVPKDSLFTVMLEKKSTAHYQNRVVDWFFRWSGDLERLAAWNPEFRITFTRHSLQYLDSMHPRDAIAWLDAVTPSMPRMRALKDMPGTKLIGGRVDFSDLYKHQRKRLADGVDETAAWLTIDDMKSMSGAVASAHNRDMFYAALNQQNFWHAARFAIPFGQPTVNAYRVFSRSVLDWRNVVTRHYPAMRALKEGQSEDSAVINEMVAEFEPGNGISQSNRPFLFREQADGPLKFRYPMIGGAMGQASDWLLGTTGAANQEMTGYLSGMNLALQGVQPMPEGLTTGEQAQFLAANAIPTVGWTMQTAADWVGVDEHYGPGWDMANQWLFQFGRPTDSEVSEMVERFMPTWARRLFLGALNGGPMGAKWRASNMRGIMAYHATRNTGTDWTTPEGKEEMLARSDRDARILTALQAIGTFFLPTAPQWAYEAIDEDGTAFAQAFVADEWRQIRERTSDWDAAVIEFMDRFGENMALLITPSTAGEPTLSTQAWEELLANDDLNNYRQVLPLFFPGDISWVAYGWQKQKGYRETLSQQERIDEAYRLVYMMQETELDRRSIVEGWSDDEYEQQKQILQDRWPTGRPKGTRQYMTSGERLRLVERAMDDTPALANTAVGEATRQALERYDYYVDLGGNKTLTGKTVEKERAAFREEVDWLFAGVPGGEAMARLFYQVTEEAG